MEYYCQWQWVICFTNIYIIISICKVLQSWIACWLWRILAQIVTIIITVFKKHVLWLSLKPFFSLHIQISESSLWLSLWQSVGSQNWPWRSRIGRILYWCFWNVMLEKTSKKNVDSQDNQWITKQTYPEFSLKAHLSYFE